MLTERQSSSSLANVLTLDVVALGARGVVVVNAAVIRVGRIPR